MHSFFPVFSYSVQSATSETVNSGLLRSLQDADLSDGLFIGCHRLKETQSIKDQGFGSEFRLKIDFEYVITIISIISEAACNEKATALLQILEPGVDIAVTYDGTAYSMYFDNIVDVVAYQQEINGWVETLTFSGYTFHKEQ